MCEKQSAFPSRVFHPPPPPLPPLSLSVCYRLSECELSWKAGGLRFWSGIISN